ncbi:MAG: hypothetical protein F4X65_15610 [Chloroflexi bacterium]|nr:hypothetical protein [Chloroflexota bacterium]
MLKLSITLPNSAQINLESEDTVVIDKILGTVLENVTRALLSGSPTGDLGSVSLAQPRASTPIVTQNEEVSSPEGESPSLPGQESPSPEQQSSPVEAPEASEASTGPEPASSQTSPSFESVGTQRQAPTDEVSLRPGELNAARQVVGEWATTENLGGMTDRPNGYPAGGNSQVNPSNLVPAVSEQAFVDFCRAANPLGDMRRVVVAAEGASRYLAMEGVDADSLGRLFDIVGWPRAHNFVQTLRNAARSKFGWLERVPGRAGHYTVTSVGRSTALGR